MKLLSDLEYMELCFQIANQQYGKTAEDYEDKPTVQHVFVKSEIKQKLMRKINHNGLIDLTDVRSDLIKDQIHRCGNIKVGNFKVIINHYDELSSNTVLYCNLSIVRHQNKTMNGLPCNIDCYHDLEKDDRFNNRSWMKYFKGNYGTNVPMDTVVEIIRWMQAIKRLTAFL